MRKLIVALSAITFAAGVTAASFEVQAAKAAAKTKMGCIVGKEKWDASVGKCAAAKPVAKAAPKKA